LPPLLNADVARSWYDDAVFELDVDVTVFREDE